MIYKLSSFCTILFLLAPGSLVSGQGQIKDCRNIRNGSVIYEHGYCDQPYVVVTKDGTWLCVFTTGAGHEGQSSQYIVSTTSKDKGKTWTPPVPIEPPTDREASWAMPLITPADRVYVFYDYNGDNIHTLNGRKIRADMIGWYSYKYSDDQGVTWSRRYRLPVRVTDCDRRNDWQGKVQILWGIGKPVRYEDSVYFAFTKLGKYMLDQGEGWFFRSDNILTESNPERIQWQMLPDGEFGLRAAPFGSVQEEQNLVTLANGDLYCMYRTTTGHPCHSYSRDGGHIWTQPVHATYTPDGKKFKHPRACPRIWKTKNGNYLFWFHNHGGKTYNGRNPAWLCGGIESNGFIHWSQPEILLYDPEPKTRMSYPDLIEQDGEYWITETQKSIARVHEIDSTLLQGLWKQVTNKTVTKKGLILSLTEKDLKQDKIKLPKLPPLHQGGGFTLDFQFRVKNLSKEQVLLDGRDTDGKGILLSTTRIGTIQCSLSDGKTIAVWDCDPGLIKVNHDHHVTIIVDGGPKIISFVVDGVLCDGGSFRQFGWGRFTNTLSDVNGSRWAVINPSAQGVLLNLRIYDRYLRTSEAIGNFRAYRMQ